MSLFTLADARAFRTSVPFQSIGSFINVAAVTDSEALSYLQSAEDEVARTLRTFLQPVTMLPNDESQAEIDRRLAAGERVELEAPYDYDPSFFQGERWGNIVVRQRPIRFLESIEFAFPLPTTMVWRLPDEWARLDKRYGQIRLVPAAKSFSAPLSAFVMQALGGGRVIPNMIRIRYGAGLENAKRDWKDVIRVIYRLATLHILQSAFIPQDQQIGTGTLTRRVNLDLNKYRADIDKSLSDLHNAIFGPVVTILG